MRWYEVVSGGVRLRSLGWLALALAAPGLAGADEPPKPLPPPVVRRLKGPAGPVPAALQPPPQVPTAPSTTTAPAALAPGTLHAPSPAGGSEAAHAGSGVPAAPLTPDTQALIAELKALREALKEVRAPAQPPAAPAPVPAQPDRATPGPDRAIRFESEAQRRFRAVPRAGPSSSVPTKHAEVSTPFLPPPDRALAAEIARNDIALGAAESERSARLALKGSRPPGLQSFREGALVESRDGADTVESSRDRLHGLTQDEERSVARRWYALPLFDARLGASYVSTRRVTVQEDARLMFKGVDSEIQLTRTSLTNVTASTTPSSTTERAVPEELKFAESLRKLFDLERLFAAPRAVMGGATVSASELKMLQAGAADPTQKGFSTSDVAVGVGAKVFLVDVDALVVASPDLDTGNEKTNDPLQLEELSAGKSFWALDHADAFGNPTGDLFAVRAAKFYMPFGIENMRAAYDQWWVDQPLCSARLLGANGLKSDLGAEGIYGSAALRTHLHVGAQNGDAGAMDPFLTEGGLKESRLGGRPYTSERDGFYDRLVYFARVQTQLTRDRRRAWVWYAGASAAVGPNGTGPDGDTQIYGADVYASGRLWGRPLALQSEFMLRRMDAAAIRADDGSVKADARQLDDWGGYVQGLLALDQDWSVGLRVDYVNGKADSIRADAAGNYSDLSRNEDPYRDERWRLSPLLIWRPIDKLRIRLQYSYDNAAHLERGEHLLWISFDGNWGWEDPLKK